MNSLDRRNVAGLAVAVLVSWVLWDTPVLYPVRLFATFCHESGHALAALLTGGHVHRIVINTNGTGVAWHSGGWELAVASGGYLGSVLFGCAILLAASGRDTSRYILEILGAALIAMTLAFGRDLFTFGYGLVTGAALWWAGRRVSPRVEFYIAQTLGVLTASMALMDIRTLFMPVHMLIGPKGVPLQTDAQALAEVTFLPAKAWAVLWALVSLAAIAVTLRTALLRRKTGVEL